MKAAPWKSSHSRRVPARVRRFSATLPIKSSAAIFATTTQLLLRYSSRGRFSVQPIVTSRLGRGVSGSATTFIGRINTYRSSAGTLVAGVI